MSYNFIDVNEQQTKASSPSEAMNFNDSFLKDLVPGYRTLSVVERELAPTEIRSYQLGIRDGMWHVYARIPERESTVKFKVEANSNEAFKDPFDRLNVTLFTEKDVQTWLNDEPEVFWSGSKSDIDAVPEGLSRVVGTFTILLNDPYKRTRNDAANVMWDSPTITSQANYLIGNIGSGTVDLPIVIKGGAYWSSTMITFQNRSYLMGDNGQEVKPIKIYPTVEGLKVKPITTIEGTGKGVWIKTRNDTINTGDFGKSEIVIDTEQFDITKDGKPMIRPMNDSYIYPNEPLYTRVKDSIFNLAIRYPNRFL